LNKPKILFVDDDPNVLAIVKEVLIDSGEFEVVTAESSKAGIKVLESDTIDLLIADEGMPECSGTELLKSVAENYPNVIRFMLTGNRTPEVAQKALNNDLIEGFFAKPWDNFEMQVSIKKALAKKKDNDSILNNEKKNLIKFKAVLNLLNKICDIKEINHIMEIILSEMISFTDSDQGVINLISPEDIKQFSTVVRVLDRNDNVLDPIIGESLAGWVMINKQQLHVEDLDNDERFSGITSLEGRYKSIICSPLIVSGELIGLITLVRNSSKEPYNMNHCRLVNLISSQAAQILTNGKLNEELAESNNLLRESLKKLKLENIQLKLNSVSNHNFENIIGQSKPIKRVLSLASQCSFNDFSVLISGETGTGKELIARAIHGNSDKKTEPFIVINCGIETETLLESELFGHVKGAFTGATQNKIGMFKEADGGTIFLDEIGDAPLSTQTAILRVIQHGEIKPLGSTKTEIVNVRILSATNKDLKNEIKSKSFREDLYYRLATFHIELPPLRERQSDIPLIVRYYLKTLNIKLRKEALRVSPDALRILMRYSWPGNIRQLENELDRAAVTCDLDGVIKPRDLSDDLFKSASDFVSPDKYEGSLKTVVESVEKDMIKSTLANNRGNISKSAQKLGLSRVGLTNKVERYKIEADFK